MIIESSGNVFSDLGFEPGEAALLQMRTKLMSDLRHSQLRDTSALTEAAAVTVELNDQRIVPIVRIPGVHGGRPVVRGTGVSVQTIVEQSHLGRSPQQFVEDFEDVLTLAQVYDAFSYYYEHQAEIDRSIAQNREALWQRPPVTASS